MRVSLKNLLISAAASVIAMGGLVACHNGSNNKRDTTGMSNSGAAGDIGPGSPASPGSAMDTSRKDTTKRDTSAQVDTTKPRP